MMKELSELDKDTNRTIQHLIDVGIFKGRINEEGGEEGIGFTNLGYDAALIILGALTHEAVQAPLGEAARMLNYTIKSYSEMSKIGVDKWSSEQR